MNLDQNVEYPQPKTADERAEIAADCVLDLDLAMPTLLDDMTNQVDTAYSALPERLYVIDREGLISWRSGMGPFGFDVDGFERAVQEQVDR